MKNRSVNKIKRGIIVGLSIIIISSILIIINLLQANTFEVRTVRISKYNSNLEFEVEKYARYIKFNIESDENKNCQVEILNPVGEIVASESLSTDSIDIQAEGKKGIWNISFDNIDENENINISYKIYVSNFKRYIEGKK